MDYLSYLNDKERNRKRKKNLVFNALYIIIPIFLLASTFTNERIITECEDIYEEKIVYEQLVKEKEVQITRLTEVCTRRVDSLSRLLGVSTEDINSITDEIQEERDRSSQLDDALDDAIESQSTTDEKLARALAKIKQLENTINGKDREIKRLNDELTTCEKVRNQALLDLEACEEKYNDISKYKGYYESEKKRFANVNRKYQDLKNKYDELLKQKSRASITRVNSIPGDDFMWIESNRSYKVTVDGKVVRYLRGDPCLK